MEYSIRVLASSFRALRDRSAEWDARLEMIASAERFLYSSTYYVGPDRIGQAVLESLSTAAERGVDATLVVDRFGQWLGASAWGPRENRRVNRWIAEAVARGVRFVWTTPTSWTRRAVGGGHHVKIQLSEHGPALFASSNLSRHSFDGWGEFSALVDGPVVETMFHAIRGVIPAPLAHRLDPRASGPSPVEMDWWWCDPNADPTAFAPLRRGTENPITDGLIRLINLAECTVAISSFYVKPEPRLRAAILAAARRGVRVQIFHSGSDALGGAEASWLAAALDYPTLLEAGVRIFEILGGEHSKLVLVDERAAVFGSYNFDHAAHDVVAEAMLASRDERVTSEVKAVFDELVQSPRCVEVERAFSGWGPQRWVHATGVRAFRRWL